ncbi:hypothetical protein BCR32DRAFT_197256, partial [Anaeromyces robustus]
LNKNSDFSDNKNLQGKILTNPSLEDCYYTNTNICYENVHSCMHYPPRNFNNVDNIPLPLLISPERIVKKC